MYRFIATVSTARTAALVALILAIAVTAAMIIHHGIATPLADGFGWTPAPTAVPLPTPSI